MARVEPQARTALPWRARRFQRGAAKSSAALAAGTTKAAKGGETPVNEARGIFFRVCSIFTKYTTKLANCTSQNAHRHPDTSMSADNSCGFGKKWTPACKTPNKTMGMAKKSVIIIAATIPPG